MALSQKYRQVGNQSGKVRVLAIGPGTHRSANVQNNLCGSRFDHRSTAPRQPFSIRSWLIVKALRTAA
jgi:hypothetical protein